MEDADIVELYFRRDQHALEETAAKYGTYLHRISMNVLGDREDAGECVNDTYLGAWNAMPPTRPAALRAFLGKIVRRISLNRLRERLSERRGGGETALAIEELGELLPTDRDTQQEAEARELTRTLNDFLAGHIHAPVLVLRPPGRHRQSVGQDRGGGQVPAPQDKGKASRLS